MFFKPVYILILAATIIIDYIAGIYIENSSSEKLRKRFLILSLVGNIGVLAIFKYYNFLNGNISGIASLLHLHNDIPYLKMILPIGLSFHTFQAMSYTIEVYRGNQKAERHFGIYALYVMFYPQLVAGPIERPQNILHQFHEKKTLTYDNLIGGLKLIAFGVFKKVVIADRLAVYVNQVYGDIGHASSISAALAVCFFSIQIYADFSGYSDIAIGSAKVMGYDLMKNFNEPFMSKSVSEFWRRWHISLSTWFNDYLFMPLMLSFRDIKVFGVALAVLITFLLSGLWHGAGWTFVIYGAMNGIAVVYELYTKKIRKKAFSFLPKILNGVISQLLVFFYLSLSWVFFRSESLSKAVLMYKKLFEFNITLNFNQIFANAGPLNFLMILFTLGLYALISKVPQKAYNKMELSYILSIIFLIVVLGKSTTSNFIYFQF